LLAPVLDRVEGRSDGPAERRAPVELQEGRREIPWQPDRDAGRRIEPTIQGGHARIAQRWALTPASDAGRRKGDVERLACRAADEIDHAARG
jgi:hypothetical protein